MFTKLLGAAAMVGVLAGVAFAAVPASAAHMAMAGCSGDNLMKTETMVEAMADGDSKSMGQREIAQAQAAMLDGKMGACAAHLTKAMHAGMMK